ncbi:CAP domain-containing protein [soil metagenome]
MIHRRHLIAGLGGLGLIAAQAGRACAADADRWLAYEGRLRARMSDGGGGRFDDGFAADLTKQTNSFRLDQGLAPLADDADLSAAARAHVADMAARAYFDHRSPEGFNSGVRTGLLIRTPLRIYGENLASQMHPDGKVLPVQTIDGWKNSPGHRQNMLNTDFSRVGHAVVRRGNTWLSAAVFGSRDPRAITPLPLRADGAAVKAVTMADHAAQAFMLSEPDADPSGATYRLDAPAPAVPPGAWRLRPVTLLGNGIFEITFGPIFAAA